MNAFVHCFEENFTLCCLSNVETYEEGSERFHIENRIKRVNGFLGFNEKVIKHGPKVLPAHVFPDRGDKFNVFTERNKKLKQ
jgi:hypothetical protein